MVSQSNLIVHSFGSNPITYQLDECASDPDLVRECSKDGLIWVRKIPSGLRGKSDEIVVEYCQQKAFPLLTADWQLPENEAASLSRSHPGVIVVRSDSRGIMNTPFILSVLGLLKSRIENWHRLVLRNSIIELSSHGAIMQRAENSQLVDREYLDFSNPDWPDSFTSIVQANCSRTDTT